MNYAIFDAICRFARVFNMCVTSSLHMHLEIHALELSTLKRFARVQGLGALVPSRHEGARCKRWWGAAVGGVLPPSSTNKERSQLAKRCDPLNACASTHRVRVTRTPGHSLLYLIITVPIDTMLIINNLQIFSLKSMGQIIQI